MTTSRDHVHALRAADCRRARVARARLASQSMTVTTAGGVVRVRAPGFRFIDGEPLARLKDGLSVRVDLELSVLARPGRPRPLQHRAGRHLF